jgi:hypothetical protein
MEAGASKISTVFNPLADFPKIARGCAILTMKGPGEPARPAGDGQVKIDVNVNVK